ncbi:MAG: 3-phosphoshikimate 1-carboxyvinyltransferase [Gammaproteobacteria bacterium]|nr:3-phosphoshikimate 1-carboxyvinyltransferase [Gammaproteobacteria bacterium]
MKLNEIQFIVKPGGKFNGKIVVPGDKSISHRSVMFGALAEGVTTVEGFLEGEDSLATLQAFRDMGVQVEGPNDGRLTIHGVGLRGLNAPLEPLNVGNSGTSMRLLSGILAGQSFDSTLIGDASLSKRPMRRVTEPLAIMGVQVDSSESGTAPLTIHGGAAIKAMSYDMPMASAQVKSCVLLAGLYADGQTCVSEPGITRDHTERMLRAFDYEVTVDANRVCLNGGGKLTGTHIVVPSDISSAAFFLVGAAITPGAELVLKQVGMNPTRTGVIDILKLMGASLSVSNEQTLGGEPVADITVKASQLKGINIPHEFVPLAIDEFPALFIAAACAQGKTLLTGAEELRVKESDRIQVMADGLHEIGVKVKVLPDGIEIDGQDALGGGEVQSHGDHRIAMAFAIAGLRATANITINDCANVATSFPNFIQLCQQCGLEIEKR